VKFCRHEDTAHSVKAESHCPIQELDPAASLPGTSLQHRPGLVGACSDAQRLSRAGEQRAGRAFMGPVPLTGSDARPSGEPSAPRTAGTRRATGSGETTTPGVDGK
jgi:hypothetical protein